MVSIARSLCLWDCVYLCPRVCVYVCAPVCVRVCVCICAPVFVGLCVCGVLSVRNENLLCVSGQVTFVLPRRVVSPRVHLETCSTLSVMLEQSF